MARKAKKNIEQPVATTAPAAVVASTPTKAQHLIVAKRSFGRWYVYLQGVAPKDNPSCACKSAKSAIRYMYLLKNRTGAAISQNIYDRLAFEASREG